MAAGSLRWTRARARSGGVCPGWGPLPESLPLPVAVFPAMARLASLLAGCCSGAQAPEDSTVFSPPPTTSPLPPQARVRLQEPIWRTASMWTTATSNGKALSGLMRGLIPKNIGIFCCIAVKNDRGSTRRHAQCSSDGHCLGDYHALRIRQACGSEGHCSGDYHALRIRET